MRDDLTRWASQIESIGVHATLGIQVVELAEERVVLSIEVGPAVHQPAGLLHGGVSALLAESAASIGAGLHIEPDKHVVGIELSASHLRGISEGTLTAAATPIRVGRTLQVWRIELHDQDGRLICDAKCTVAVVGAPGA
jgi:uncharacterized protein (TIGR00369 family)